MGPTEQTALMVPMVAGAPMPVAAIAEAVVSVVVAPGQQADVGTPVLLAQQARTIRLSAALAAAAAAMVGLVVMTVIRERVVPVVGVQLARPGPMVHQLATLEV